MFIILFQNLWKVSLPSKDFEVSRSDFRKPLFAMRIPPPNPPPSPPPPPPPPPPPFLRHFGAQETRNSLAYPRITCIILSNLGHFSQFVLSTPLCCFINFYRIIKLLAYFQLFSSDQFFHLLTTLLSTRFLRYLRTPLLPALHTKDAAFTRVTSCARTLRQFISS